MKPKGKRFFTFEVMMLICGIMTGCVDALNYGIALFYVIGKLIVYPLIFVLSGIITWKIIKDCIYWKLVGFSLSLTTLIYGLFHVILYPVYGIPVDSYTFLYSVCFFIFSSVVPVLICCGFYKLIVKYIK